MAQAAGKDPDLASVLDYAPSALDSISAKSIARLAEGFNYIFIYQPVQARVQAALEANTISQIMPRGTKSPT